MSYRTYVNDTQLFGNNEYHEEWIKFIESQGIEVNEDGCYNGYITDVMGAIETIEAIIEHMEKERQEEILSFKRIYRHKKKSDIFVPEPTSLFDFQTKYTNFKKVHEKSVDRGDTTCIESLTDIMMTTRTYAYIFLSCLFIDACGDAIKASRPFSIPGHYHCYELKENGKIFVKGG